MHRKILYLHGWNSAPDGPKPAYLVAQGLHLIQPALPNDDFDAAVALAREAFANHQPAVVVGSSRGGAIAMNLDVGDVPLVLLCPAWKRWGQANSVKTGSLVLHARLDDVVPFADSAELVRASGLPESALIVVGQDHRLSDARSLDVIHQSVLRQLGDSR